MQVCTNISSFIQVWDKRYKYKIFHGTETLHQSYKETLIHNNHLHLIHHVQYLIVSLQKKFNFIQFRAHYKYSFKLQKGIKNHPYRKYLEAARISSTGLNDSVVPQNLPSHISQNISRKIHKSNPARHIQVFSCQAIYDTIFSNSGSAQESNL